MTEGKFDPPDSFNTGDSMAGQKSQGDASQAMFNDSYSNFGSGWHGGYGGPHGMGHGAGRYQLGEPGEPGNWRHHGLMEGARWGDSREMRDGRPNGFGFWRISEEQREQRDWRVFHRFFMHHREGQNDPTMHQVLKDASQQMSYQGFRALNMALSLDHRLNPQADDATRLQEAEQQLQTAGLSQQDLAALQTIAQKDLQPAQAADAQPVQQADSTAPVQTDFTPDGSGAPAPVVPSTPDVSAGSAPDTGQPPPSNQDAGASATQPDSSQQVDPTLQAIVQDAQQQLSPDAFQALVQQLETDLSNGQSTDTATLLQQVEAELQTAGKLPAADLTKLQALVQTDLSAANGTQSASLTPGQVDGAPGSVTDGAPSPVPAPGAVTDGAPSNVPAPGTLADNAPLADAAPGTGASGDGTPDDATQLALKKVVADAQASMTPDGFNAFMQQAQTDASTSTAPDLGTFLNQVGQELQQTGKFSDQDLAALSKIIQTDAPAQSTGQPDAVTAQTTPGPLDGSTSLANPDGAAQPDSSQSGTGQSS